MKQKKEEKKRFIIEIKPLGNFVLPAKGKRGSVGYDLTVPDDVIIPAHSRVLVSLNFAINLPKNYEAKIEARSGFSAFGIEGYGTKYICRRFLLFFKRKVAKSGLQRFDADVLTLKVDPNYTDSVGVIIRNNDERFVLRKGTRIAQMTIYRTTPVWFERVDQLSCAIRIGGYDSSGTVAEQK